MASSISRHPVKKSIYFHPCNLILYPQSTCSVLLCRVFLTSKLAAYLVAFGNITWELRGRNFGILAKHCPFNCIAVNLGTTHDHCYQQKLQLCSAIGN